MSRSVTQHLFDSTRCRIPQEVADTEVALENGIYHKPDSLPTTRGMEIVSEGVAYHKHGATACSKCFASQKAGIYPNDYLR